MCAEHIDEARDGNKVKYCSKRSSNVLFSKSSQYCNLILVMLHGQVIRMIVLDIKANKGITLLCDMILAYHINLLFTTES